MSIKSTVNKVFRGIINLPQTLYLNLIALPFEQGKKFPIVVMSKVSAKGLNRKNFKIEGPVKTGMIRLGALKTGKKGLHVNKKTSMMIEKGGSITFQGPASVGKGTAICASGGNIVLGDQFSCNINCFIYSQREIRFGEDVLLGWNINVRDNDGHPLYDVDHHVINEPRGICLEDHVWIGAYADIMKGVQLPKGTIVSTRSVVTKSFSDEHTVIAGIPARVVKKDIYWEHSISED